MPGFREALAFWGACRKAADKATLPADAVDLRGTASP
jgi:hypothetical protein